MVAAPQPPIRRARRLRKDMSLPEVMLWNILRQRPNGFKFRRQHPIGRFVLDFYCLEHRIAVEIDGIAHDMGNQPECDAARDALLKSKGVRTIRVAAQDVLKDASGVAQSIIDLVAPQTGA